MEAQFINPVLGAVLEVLATMAQLQPKAGTPQKKM